MDKGVNLSFANTDSPSTGAPSVNMAKYKRISLLDSSIQLFSPQIDLNVVEAHEGGQVSIHINSVIDINDRGEFLLNLEEYLKSTIDIRINIWHEPIGDKSSLRNLRGIEVFS